MSQAPSEEAKKPRPNYPMSKSNGASGARRVLDASSRARGRDCYIIQGLGARRFEVLATLEVKTKRGR